MGQQPRGRTYTPQPGLQRIPQGVAEQVKAQHGEAKHTPLCRRWARVPSGVQG